MMPKLDKNMDQLMKASNLDYSAKDAQLIEISENDMKDWLNMFWSEVKKAETFYNSKHQELLSEFKDLKRMYKEKSRFEDL